MEENQGPSTNTPHVGPPAVWVTAAVAGPQVGGAVFLTLYGMASVADFKTTTPVVAFSGFLTAQTAQDLLTNLDGAIMEAAKAAK